MTATGSETGGRHSGRRPGRSDTREQILAAARRLFAADGFDRTSIRGIAAEAGVDPALVLHYFGTKDGLLQAAAKWPIDLDDLVVRVVAPGVEGVGGRLVEFYLDQWEDPAVRFPLAVMLRGATGRGEAGRVLTQFVQHELVDRLAAIIDAPDARLRASFVSSTLVGLALSRYIMEVEPLASASREEIVAAVAPTIERYVRGDSPTPEAP